jgi:hypothetical protein
MLDKSLKVGVVVIMGPAGLWVAKCLGPLQLLSPRLLGNRNSPAI